MPFLLRRVLQTAASGNARVVDQRREAPKGVVRLQVRQSDFTTSARIVEAVNKKFDQAARADNAGLVSIAIPTTYSARTIEFQSF